MSIAPLPLLVPVIPIMCARCEKRVDVLLKLRLCTDRGWLAHVRCHDVERLVVLRDACDRGDSITWDQLHDFRSDDELPSTQRRYEEDAQDFWKLAGAIASVLRSRKPR